MLTGSDVVGPDESFRPSFTILCDRLPIAQSAATVLSALGFPQSPNASLKLIFDAPPSYALHALESVSGPHSRAIVVTWNECAEHLEDLWDMGLGALIAGEHYDTDAAAVLSKAIEKVSGGERYRLTPWRHVRLTDRDRTMLRHEACGLTNAEIGERVGVTEQSVSKRLTAVYQKLGLRNRAQAVRYYWGIDYGCGSDTREVH